MAIPTLNDKAKSLADEIGWKIFDQSAETVSELVQNTGMSDKSLYKLIKNRLASGTWELVYKRVGLSVVRAYRRAKKK